MKTTLFALSLLLSARAFAGSSASANYTTTTEALDAGGRAATSASYANDSSIGAIGGIVTLSSYTSRAGFPGQLYDTGNSLEVTAPFSYISESVGTQLTVRRICTDTTLLTLAPTAVTSDNSGERDPWVELYNGGTSNISLSGYSLANNYTNLAQWAFPANAVIGPKQFLVVWLDAEPGESTTSEFHANFRATPDIGSVVLSKGSNLASVIDHLNYSVPVAGRSYGSFPDGAVSGRRSMTVVTPNATNNPTSAPIDVRINEWMADNLTTLADPADGNYEDWIELYNPATNAVDLTGFFMSDTTNTTQWPIPAGTTIPAHGYLLVWADGETGQNSPARADIHASFSLAKGGEAIALFAPDGKVIDAVTFGAQTTDVSQGRFEDGAALFYFMTNATPRAANYLFTPNTPPTLALIADKTVDEGSLLSFTCVASDTNVPAQTLAFSLDAGAPAGVSLNATNGQFTWTPLEAQGPGVYPVRSDRSLSW